MFSGVRLRSHCQDYCTQTLLAQFFQYSTGLLAEYQSRKNDPAEQVALGSQILRKGRPQWPKPQQRRGRARAVLNQPVTPAQKAFPRHYYEHVWPWPGIDSKLAHSIAFETLLLAVTRDGARQRMRRKSAPENRRICATSGSLPGGNDSTRSTRSSPVVSVPVLSRATVVTPASFSTAARRLETECRAVADQAMAASTAEGIERTRAHGRGYDEQRHRSIKCAVAGALGSNGGSDMAHHPHEKHGEGKTSTEYSINEPNLSVNCWAGAFCCCASLIRRMTLWSELSDAGRKTIASIAPHNVDCSGKHVVANSFSTGR